jgi:hypothetical protein
MKEINTYLSENSINNINGLKNNEKFNNKNFPETFNKLIELQSLIRKESSLKELCK